MYDQPPPYRTYLLMLWQERGQTATVWRFRLENPRTGERRDFASLEALVTSLQAEMTNLVNADSPGASPSSRNE